jgi:hypothetical protein
MKRVIHINHYHVSMTTFNDDSTVVRTELVPGKRYEFHDCPAELTTRLQSTRAGNAAWWLCGSNAARALNEAPHQPIIRGYVSVFEWKPPASKDNRRLFYYEYPSQEELESANHGNHVIQGGSNVVNWFAYVVAPMPDPLREKIAKLVDHVAPLWIEAHRQGHLEVVNFVLGEDNQLWQELNQMLPGAGSGFRALYNHYIYPVYKYAWRVIDGVAYAVFVGAGDAVYITSEDHEDEHLCIKPMQLCVARHPVPQPQRGVD